MKTPRASPSSCAPGTERERDEILARLTDTAKRLSQVTTARAASARWKSRAQVLKESRGELRARAERAERDLDAARAELATHRQDSGTADAAAAPKRQRGSQE